MTRLDRLKVGAVILVIAVMGAPPALIAARLWWEFTTWAWEFFWTGCCAP